MLRLLTVLALTLVGLPGTALAAQTSQPLSRSIPLYGSDWYLVTIDFGSTPQTVSVNLSATTAASTGIVGSITDLDGSAAAVQPFSDPQLFAQVGILAAGTLSANLTTRTYSGTHDFIVSLNPTNNPMPVVTDYVGSVGVSGGTIVQKSVYFHVGGPGPLPGFAYWERFSREGSYFADHTGVSVYVQEIYIDVGATPRNANLSISVNGFELQNFQVFQVNGNAAGSVLYNANLSGSSMVSTGSLIQTGLESGVILLRVTSTAKTPIATGANVSWTVFTDSQTMLTTAPAKGSKGAGGGGSCSSTDANSCAIALCSLMSALVVMFRKRQRAR